MRIASMVSALASGPAMIIAGSAGTTCSRQKHRKSTPRSAETRSADDGQSALPCATRGRVRPRVSAPDLPTCLRASLPDGRASSDGRDHCVMGEVWHAAAAASRVTAGPLSSASAALACRGSRSRVPRMRQPGTANYDRDSDSYEPVEQALGPGRIVRYRDREDQRAHDQRYDQDAMSPTFK